MAEIISQYNLSGIVSGDNPKAIIEDKKSQKSYFLREGESAGDLTVEKIGAGKVSLDYKGEKFELVL
jgi:type II secretory pathway component PulC